MEEDAENPKKDGEEDENEDEEDESESDDEGSPRPGEGPGAGGGGIFGWRSKAGARNKDRNLQKRLSRCLQWSCSRKRCGFPKCRCCVYYFPCFYCCAPDLMLDKKVLTDQLKRASNGKPVNMALVEDTLSADRERRREHKIMWKRRWRICCCTFILAALAALGVLVVIFAISPWTQLCDDCGWPGRAHFGAVLNREGRIVIVGGRDGSQNFGDVWSGNQEGQDWNRLVEVANFGARHGHAVLSDRQSGELFVIGGDKGGVGQLESLPMRDVWRSTDGKNWVLQTEEAPWAARKFFGAVTDQEGRLFIAGGLSGHGDGGLNDMWRSEDKGVTWQAVALAAPWSARHSFPLVRLPGGMLEGDMYLLGGTDGFAHHDVWQGDAEGASWSLMSFTHRREYSYDSFEDRASWEPRAASAAVADSKGLVKVFGGRLDTEGAEGFFSREAWELPSPEGPPSEWWQKNSQDDRLNVRHTPLEWKLGTVPPWPARAGLQAFVDPETGSAFVLGGEGRDGFKADLWKEVLSINFVNLYNMLELMFLQVAAR